MKTYVDGLISWNKISYTFQEYPDTKGDYLSEK
jgi:hypothetical protein